MALPRSFTHSLHLAWLDSFSPPNKDNPMRNRTTEKAREERLHWILTSLFHHNWPQYPHGRFRPLSEYDSSELWDKKEKISIFNPQLTTLGSSQDKKEKRDLFQAWDTLSLRPLSRRNAHHGTFRQLRKGSNNRRRRKREDKISGSVAHYHVVQSLLSSPPKFCPTIWWANKETSSH